MEEHLEIEMEVDYGELHYQQQPQSLVNTPVSGAVMGGNHTPVATPVSSPRERRQDSERTKRGRKNHQKKKKKQKKSNCKPWQECWLKVHPYDPYSDVQNIYYNFDKACQHPLGTLGPTNLPVSQGGACDPSTPVFSLPPPQGF
jgi:hypothetical protein